MRLLELVRRYPLALLAGVALAFVSWVWWDALPEAESPQPVPTGMVRVLPHPLAVAEVPGLDLDDNFTKGLPKLKPGMTRAEVEKLVGAPGDILPATVTGDRVTYYTAYEADFGAPRTVRPIRPLPKPSAERGAVVSLEFDATRPGHPLLNVHYPDPLF